MKCFVFAGELSADQHGAKLLTALRKHFSDLSFFGVAGPEMRAQNVQTILKMEDFSVMGFSDVLRSFPRLWKQFRLVREDILKTSPEMVLFIDSPSFSLRMARSLRQRRYKGKIVQYISPTVWAWGKDRVHEMAKSFDLLLTIYPFEAAYFAGTSLSVEYVGNPVEEAIRNHHYDPYWAEKFAIESTNHLVALFPGSRPSEILRNLPVQLEAVKMMQREFPEVFVAISCAQENSFTLVQQTLKDNPIGKVFLIPKTYSYELMQTARSAVAKSGTVTLELALHRCPTVVTYQLTLLNRLIAKYLLRVKLPYYCIVNILGGKSIFPELIEERFTAQDIYARLVKIHQEGTIREECQSGCDEVLEKLKGDDVSDRAADAIKRTLARS